MSEGRGFEQLSLSTLGYYFVDLDGFRGFILRKTHKERVKVINDDKKCFVKDNEE